MKNIIFDWSGTLLNNHDLMYRSVKKIFADYGKECTYEMYCKEFKQPLYMFYQIHLPQVPEQEIKKKFVQYYSDEKMPELFSGVLDEMQKLKSEGSSLFVFSSQSVHLLEKEMKVNLLMPLIVNYQGNVRDKKKELPNFISRLGLKKEETCYVGDMTDDIEAAHTSNIMSVAVGWGYHHRNDMESMRPSVILDFTNQLSKLKYTRKDCFAALLKGS